jgi:3-oxoacyl-[acyl-carrier protein] reductase
MSELENWVGIVTGSATGIGAATARMLAAKGACVVINYTRSETEAKETVEACRAAGGEAILCQANVAEDADCRRMAQAALDEWGRIDGLVNNAGTTKIVPHDDLDGLSSEDFQRIYAVNVVGPFQMTRAVVPTMKAQGAGSIVNISSIAGVAGVGSSVAYAASKGALNTMTLSLARALGPEIRFNTVCPGFVQGRWQREWLGEEGYAARIASEEASTPLGRAGSPEDMAEVALMFLLGCHNVTGEIIMSDSGRHLDFAAAKAR